jgi:hypothetical protein
MHTTQLRPEVQVARRIVAEREVARHLARVQAAEAIIADPEVHGETLDEALIEVAQAGADLRYARHVLATMATR